MVCSGSWHGALVHLCCLRLAASRMIPLTFWVTKRPLRTAGGEDPSHVGGLAGSDVTLDGLQVLALP
jgi:hypothetical protein